MKQTDYNQQSSFARPGQRMQQGQQGYMQPGQRLPQNRIQQPQMTMPGGNYAAPGGYPQQQMGAGMFPPSYGVQMGGFQPAMQQGQQAGWQQPMYKDPESIRDVMSEEQAQKASESMDALVSKLNGIDPELAEVKVGAANSDALDIFYQNIQRVLDGLIHPDMWIPKAHGDYINKIAPYAKKLAEKLDNFGTQILKLK